MKKLVYLFGGLAIIATIADLVTTLMGQPLGLKEVNPLIFLLPIFCIFTGFMICKKSTNKYIHLSIVILFASIFIILTYSAISNLEEIRRLLTKML